MAVEVIFDPFRTVVEAFEALYPGKDCTVAWCDQDILDEGAHGRTCFPDNGGKPEVLVGIHLPLEAAVEVLAHELAHIAAGPEGYHGPAWEEAFSAIHAEYCRRVEGAEASHA